MNTRMCDLFLLFLIEERIANEQPFDLGYRTSYEIDYSKVLYLT